VHLPSHDAAAVQVFDDCTWPESQDDPRSAICSENGHGLAECANASSCVRALHIYSGNLFGGIESFLVTLARHDGKIGTTRSEFALSYEGRLSQELQRVGAKVHRLGEARLRRPWSVVAARHRLKRLLRSGAYDLVISHAPWVQALFGSVPPSIGMPQVYWQHDAAKGRHWTELGATLSKPDLVICNSVFTQGTLRTLFRSAPSVVCRYPVEVTTVQLSQEERKAVRHEMGVAQDDVVVIQTSRMQQWKGQLRQLRALSRLRDIRGWISVQVGGPQRPSEHAYFNEVVATARRLGIEDRVRFLGQRDDVPRLLAAADVHCQPNEGPEPFGIAFVEALAAGLPVVTMDIGAAREIVTSDVGLLAGSETSLSEALHAVISSPDLRRKLAAAAPARARVLCEPTHQLLEMEGVFKRVLSARRENVSG
jgi:glycosyltransferase involved in cell wall biosynthesis